MVVIQAGTYTLGSDSLERELGYSLSPSVVRQQAWYDRREEPPYQVALPAYAIDATPVTQGQYAAFVATSGSRIAESRRSRASAPSAFTPWSARAVRPRPSRSRPLRI